MHIKSSTAFFACILGNQVSILTQHLTRRHSADNARTHDPRTVTYSIHCIRLYASNFARQSWDNSVFVFGSTQIMRQPTASMVLHLARLDDASTVDCT